MAQVIRDNRENPDQTHYHLVWRQPLPQGHRLTLDALYKTGTVEGESTFSVAFTPVCLGSARNCGQFARTSNAACARSPPPRMHAASAPVRR